METKRQLRKRILAVRDGMPEEERKGYSERIAGQLTGLAAYQSSRVILAYVNYRSEVETKNLILQAFSDGKIVFVPRVCGEEMEFYRLDSLAELAEGYRGILEPVGDCAFSGWKREHGADSGMLWMPGAVFDRKRHRIGYGKGYYDRYIGGCAGAGLVTAALAYACQIVDEIPFERHDITPDMVITEQGIL